MKKQSDAAELLTALNKIQPLGSKETKNSIEAVSDKIRNWLLLIATIFFIILLLLIGVQKFIVELSSALKFIAMIILVVTMLLPIISMLIDMALSVYQIIRLKTETFRMILLEVNHDKSNVDAIVQFEKKKIKEVKDWLEIKCSRIKMKIGLFFGGSEKIALISLAGFGWFAFKEVFHGEIPKSFPSASENPLQFTLLIIIAFFTGLSIGATLLNQQLRCYTYHMEILEIALKRKSE